jgi:hypothetical protein
MGQGFVINALMTVALVGVPTFAHHFWTTRRGNRSADEAGQEPSSMSYSYYRVLRHIAMWFGTMYMLVGSIIFVCALVDVAGHAGFGYPLWSLPVIAAQVALGYGIRRIAKASLQRRD